MSKLIVVLGVILMSWGVGLGAYQAEYWFRYGLKMNISVLDALIYLDQRLGHFSSWDWLKRLQEYPGAYGLLDQISFAVLLFVSGLVLLVLARFVAQLEKERRLKRIRRHP